MQSLLQTLQDHDPGHLRIIAELWGFDLPSAPSLKVAEWLASSMLVEGTVLETLESLPHPARTALNDLLRQGGRAPLPDVVRRFGAIREMGAGRRDREKPWRNPISGLEMLWYRGLVARAFADTPVGAQEFAFIPSDLLPLLPEPESSTKFVPGQESLKPVHIESTSTSIVDDATTLLAFLRREPIRSVGLEDAQQARLMPFLLQPRSLELIFCLLKEAGILSDPPMQPVPAAVRSLLEAPKEKVIAQLLLTWKASIRWNDLQHTPSISHSGKQWPNDPRSGRQAVLEFLQQISPGSWWDLNSFVNAIREQHPGFQRPAGEFDSWYLQDSQTGTFLQGFEHWDAVEGALLRYLLHGPLYWLGVTELGGPEKDTPFTSFRLTPRVKYLSTDFVADQEQAEKAIAISPDGRILVLHSAAQSHHYQIARFCDWIGLEGEGHRYRISPTALERATDQGLKPKQINIILEKASGGPLHQTLVKAMARWETKGREARLERIHILRVKDQEVLKALQENRATAHFLQEVLGSTTAVVREKDWDGLCSAAARAGILVDRPPSEK
jgi:hypothetical protein